MNDDAADTRELQREVERSLNRIERAGYDLRPLFKSARRDVRADQRAHKKAQAGPDGPWQALADSTIAKRRARSGKVGRPRRRPPKPRRENKLGRLPTAFKITYGRNFIRADSLVKWSLAHQKGGRVGRRRRVRLPKREFMWVSAKLLNTVANKTVDFLLGAWELRNRLR